MKIAVIIYYDNPLLKYKPQWIYDCLKSIQTQTFTDYEIHELNYSKKSVSLVDKLGFFKNKKKYYYHQHFDSKINAFNYILEKVFIEKECNLIFNVDLKDLYVKDRFKSQYEKIKSGYSIIFSNMFDFYIYSVNESQKNKKVIKKDISRFMEDYISHKSYITNKLLKNEDFLPFSSLCMTRDCWIKAKPIITDINQFYKIILKNNDKMLITDEYLLYNRII